MTLGNVKATNVISIHVMLQPIRSISVSPKQWYFYLPPRGDSWFYIFFYVNLSFADIYTPPKHLSIPNQFEIHRNNPAWPRFPQTDNPAYSGMFCKHEYDIMRSPSGENWTLPVWYIFCLAELIYDLNNRQILWRKCPKPVKIQFLRPSGQFYKTGKEKRALTICRLFGQDKWLGICYNFPITKLSLTVIQMNLMLIQKRPQSNVI